MLSLTAPEDGSSQRRACNVEVLTAVQLDGGYWRRLAVTDKQTMNVAVQVDFKADRKEPLGALLRRVVAAFDGAGLLPDVQASFSDGPGGITKTSAVERALKKHPHLARLDRHDAPLPLPGIPSIRRITSDGSGQSFSLVDLLALADGVPRSLPFHAVSVHFGHAEFGEVTWFHKGLAPAPGITVGDGWWVSGRHRSLSAFYGVEADPQSKTLPGPPPAITALIAALGKPKKTAQFVAPSGAATDGSAATAVPIGMAAVVAILAKYRADMPALIKRLPLPHDLPAPVDVVRDRAAATGPLKPTLVAAFKPRGYDCRGESGTFTLRRRTASNHIVDLELDVGTWSRSLTSMLHVHGPGFNATLVLPVTPRGGGQYPIGDTANWERIIANLAAIVDELERTFVAEIAAAAGPAPAWFVPGR